MGSSNPVRPVAVERIVPLDPTMVRVTLRATDGSVPEALRVHAGYCRLVFPDDRAGAPVWPRVFTYSRWHDGGRFDIDFVRHGGSGPAAKWLPEARAGDVIGWRHGGPPKLTLDADLPGPVVLIGDATARPVISALLERAQAGLCGDVVLLLPHVDGQFPLAAPAGVSVRTVASAAACEKALRRLALPPTTTVFAALEAGAMRAVRRIALDEHSLPRERVFTSGYWKAGLSAEEIDAEKRRPDWFGDAADHFAHGYPERSNGRKASAVDPRTR
jgi:NADPH-dependent ferric siderophore reductase